MREGARAALREGDARAPGTAAVRAQDDPRDGLRGLLPDRLGLRRLREAERHQRRSGPRLGRRLARRLLPRDHRPRPDPLRPALRALPQPGPQVACPTSTSTSPSRAASASSTTCAEKYGRDRVAQIITFSTMAARAAMRDAGRVLEIPYGVVDQIAKLVPEGPGQTLDECLKPGAELKTAYDADPVAKEIVDLAQPLEGLARQDSIHAAGVVIGAEPLMNVVPLQQKGADQEVVTQFADERRRGARAPEDGLPRAAQPRRDRHGGASSSAAASTSSAVAARRPQDVRDARARRGDRRLPVRVVGHARGAAAGEADRVRGPDRARRPLPAGADGVHPGLRAPQARPGGGHLPRPAPEADHAATRTGSASTRSSTWRSPRSSPASRPPRPTTCARRSARRSTR